MNLYTNEFLNGWYAARREREMGQTLENPYDEESQFKSHEDWDDGYRKYDELGIDEMFPLIFPNVQ